jgi:hypothetical protein
VVNGFQRLQLTVFKSNILQIQADPSLYLSYIRTACITCGSASVAAKSATSRTFVRFESVRLEDCQLEDCQLCMESLSPDEKAQSATDEAAEATGHHGSSSEIRNLRDHNPSQINWLEILAFMGCQSPFVHHNPYQGIRHTADRTADGDFGVLGWRGQGS